MVDARVLFTAVLSKLRETSSAIERRSSMLAAKKERPKVTYLWNASSSKLRMHWRMKQIRATPSKVKRTSKKML